METPIRLPHSVRSHHSCGRFKNAVALTYSLSASSSHAASRLAYLMLVPHEAPSEWTLGICLSNGARYLHNEILRPWGLQSDTSMMW
jgi:hypothetical protein